MDRNTVASILDSAVATISSGQSLSSSVDLGGTRLFGIKMPAAWTAANITFQASFDGGATWVNMYDTYGNELTVTPAANRFITIDPVNFAAVQLLRIRSGTAATPVNQAQNSDLTLILRTI